MVETLNKGDAKNNVEVDYSRKHNMAIYEPYSAEVEYRIFAPTGFKIRKDYKSKSVKLGPAILDFAYSVEKENGKDVYVATYKFNTVKGIYSPSEVINFRNEVRDLAKKFYFEFEFDNIGFSYLNQGKIKLALNQFKMLIKNDPNEYINHVYMTKALLKAGFGEAAVQEAQLAVKLSPKSVRAHAALGFALEHDAIGRRFGKGFDKEKAKSVYKTAIELDPTDEIARISLAILLEHDLSGKRYSKKADLKGAIKHYKILHEQVGENEYDTNLMITMAMAGEFDELIKFTDKLEVSYNKILYYLIALAATKGSETAIKEAAELVSNSSERNKILKQISAYLLGARLYSEAADILVAASKGEQNAYMDVARAGYLKKITPVENIKMSMDNPISAATMIKYKISQKDMTKKQYENLLSKEFMICKDLNLYEQRILENYTASSVFGKLTGLPDSTMFDLFFSNINTKQDGDIKTGFRLKMELSTLTGVIKDNIYLVKEDDFYKIRAFTKNYSDFGHIALTHLQNSQIESSLKWLNWLYDNIENLTFSKDTSPYLFKRIWKLSDKNNKNHIKQAAAVIMSNGVCTSKKSISILKKEIKKEKDKNKNEIMQLALLHALFISKNYKELLSTVSKIDLKPDDSPFYYRLKSFAMRTLGKDVSEVKKEIEKVLEKNKDIYLTLELADIFRYENKINESVNILKKLLETETTNSYIYNKIAWTMLFLKEYPDEMLTFATKANTLTKFSSDKILHTLATVYAELNKSDDARQILLRSLETRYKQEVKEYDMYVLARIAQNYELYSIAKELYKKIKKPKEFKADSIYNLTIKRLKEIKKN